MKRETMPELKAQAREVWRLSLPAILTQITTIAMQYIDSAMVGALGANASASIGLVSTSTWLIGGIIGGVSAGFSVQASHRIGGGDDRGARTVVRHGLVTGMLIRRSLPRSPRSSAGRSRAGSTATRRSALTRARIS